MAVKKKTRRTVFLNSMENKACLQLAERGMHAKTIQECTGLTPSQVYYRCKKAGISTRDYRNGEGRFGEVIFRRFKVV